MKFVVTNYYERKIVKDLGMLFFDSSNRPKITPLNESAIYRILEKKYNQKELMYAVTKLQNKSVPQNKRIICRSKTHHLLGKIKFYYPAIFRRLQEKEKIKKKITTRTQLIERYSRIDNITMLGNHLHYLIKNELRSNNFEILAEKTNEFGSKRWHSSHTLDFIAQHLQTGKMIGVEVKNTLDIIPNKELDIKIDMCKFLGIIPVFACRWLKPHREKIRNKGGFCWEFEKQLYPFGQETLVKKLKKTLQLPVEVAGEIPDNARKSFQYWLKNNSD